MWVASSHLSFSAWNSTFSDTAGWPLGVAADADVGETVVELVQGDEEVVRVLATALKQRCRSGVRAGHRSSVLARQRRR
jgi:hypothetical protein